MWGMRDVRQCSCSAPVSPAVFSTIGQSHVWLTTQSPISLAPIYNRTKWGAYIYFLSTDSLYKNPPQSTKFHHHKMNQLHFRFHITLLKHPMDIKLAWMILISLWDLSALDMRLCCVNSVRIVGKLSRYMCTRSSEETHAVTVWGK